MVKTKAVKVEGEVISVPDDKLKLDEKPVEVSYSQAKKLVKKDMSEEQKANIEKLVEANRIKWEQRKQLKEEQLKKQQEQKEEAELETHTKVIVKPKRIYKPRPKPQKESKQESESELDASESEEEYQLRKTKKKVETKKQLISDIDNFIKQVKKPNNYMDALNTVWK